MDLGIPVPACEFGDPRLPERFWRKAQVADTGCWIWTAALDAYGYGFFSWESKLRKAHRVVASVLYGELGPHHVLHSCDTPACVRPVHLFVGDHSRNMQDRAAKGRAPGQRTTHCPNGHPWDERNTQQGGPGQGRKCRRCNANRMAGRPLTD